MNPGLPTLYTDDDIKGYLEVTDVVCKEARDTLLELTRMLEEGDLSVVTRDYLDKMADASKKMTIAHMLTDAFYLLQKSRGGDNSNAPVDNVTEEVTVVKVSLDPDEEVEEVSLNP